MYVMCRPKLRSGHVVLEPLIAIENLRPRRLIGESKQVEPRIAHLYLSYTVDRLYTFWTFSNSEDMHRVIDEMENTLRAGGILFAERWTPFRQAVELMRSGFSRQDLPKGVFIHPTRNCRAIIDSLPESDDPIH
jgi:hypothetical protein